VNNRGQFSIIAALFVAVILVSAVMVTYSTIRYSSGQDEPQTLSAIDETNLALKQVLGFTVGYYGSVLQVTGNSTYARALATTYLDSGLKNIADIRPEWGSSFTVTNLDLSTNWFTNASYSQGNIVVTYALTGLGISGVTFSASCKLDVEISRSPSSTQVCLTVLKDENLPLNDLSKQNFKFYRYRYSNLTWEMVSPSSEPTSFSNGTYLINVPPEINPYAYTIQVADTRGITVAASSFSHYTSTLLFNSSFVPGGDYVDNYASTMDSSPEKGAHSNFTAQQYGPDGIYDTLTEENVGTLTQNYYPTNYSPLGSTSLVSGGLSDLQSDNGVGMTFRSYTSGTSAQTIYSHKETTSLGGTNYYNLLSNSADSSALNLPASMGSATRTRFGKSVFSLQGISYLPVGTWPIYYRAWRDTPSSSVTTNSPSSSGGSWSHPTRAYGDDTDYTHANNNGVQGTYNGYGFAFSSNTVITQVRVRLDAWCTTNDDVKLEVSDGSSWLATTQTLDLATSQTQYWVNVTSWTGWTPTKINNISVRVTDVVSGSVDEVRLDWIPVEVTYAVGPVGHVDVDLLIRKSDGSIRTTIATNVAPSTDLSSTPTTLSGSYAWSSYSVASQTDYLEIDYYVDVSVANSVNAHLIFDDNTLALSEQTRTNILLANEFTCEVELTGLSNTANWNNLTWTIGGSSSVSVPVTLQLFNYSAGQYPSSGTGYLAATLGTTDLTKEENITVQPADFRDVIGGWKLKFKAVKTTPAPFDVNIDFARYRTGAALYALDLEEQWTDVNFTAPHPALCINASVISSENLLVDVWYGGSWHNIVTGLVTGWNNVSVTSYVDSPTFTIRFRGAYCGGNDTFQDNWAIESILLRSDSDQELFTSLPDAYCAVELLQNGTIRWLGQNLQLTTQEIPLPPVPVKAIHVNQTINGINQEVPFQVEDWASGYTIPLGLTNNATVFSNKQMVVFLVNTQVSKFTIWWNGSDTATQTPLAFTNRYFNDNPSTRTLSNGRLTTQFAASGFTVTSTAGSTSSTAKLMRINNEEDTTDPELAYVICNGVVRDIVQGEAEFSGGAENCSNLYANIVLTLPANTTYYTYQLRLMFANSQQDRNLTDLCPIKLFSSISQIQTEDGVLLNDPIVTDGSGTFYNYNYPGAIWAPHHWSQFTDGTKGAGIMFTDSANQRLYGFDSAAGSATGALKVDTSPSPKTIELLPVTRTSVLHFNSVFDITWSGAVVTFDGTNPIYKEVGGTKTGLWILAEIPPTITVSTDN
jgi:hypothetical protein